jgi:translation initiation factor IF-3
VTGESHLARPREEKSNPGTMDESLILRFPGEDSSETIPGRALLSRKRTGTSRRRTALQMLYFLLQCNPSRVHPNPINAWRPTGTLWRHPIPPIDKRSAKSFIRTNERIRAREVRVIDENGEQLGVMPPFDALKMARERALDLVEISPNAVPPVCKIQDYGKYLYEKDKSDRAARKKQKVITIKEVKFSVTVDEHDYQTKKNQAVRFLGEGDKVKASLRFKGRQMAHRDLGYKIINRLILDIGDAGLVEFMPRMEGTTLHAIIAPSKKAEQQPPVVRKPAPPAPPAVPAPAEKAPAEA